MTNKSQFTLFVHVAVSSKAMKQDWHNGFIINGANRMIPLKNGKILLKEND